ncbi:OB-fold domain-containing protein [Pseudonocardia sp. KRD-184]|uniref:OB-fold domain-containing protein n=1 Tax=Pseudonocardia oceani TaxID=2792013 RepID=A0ABS6UD10_9PSEU|nr:OB-fold domain-containing protein [Pseudonocardia oceani]MBW0092278.1 OB-fold domain-containing protein [Pseudonocardia oceani]MBW0099269.1 OB-fold domain-containing protein [Pseudonocardia oceani]MBW0111785.1 OB-fold domain-containing protein [Pseudonocardia oceani]MBW0125253.1 OB-fold domain-containing protein [Pseudonocardia oceani]MBW0130134.1 OB-fold domain-containing protein [Pseudonocardia oceani]
MTSELGVGRPTKRRPGAAVGGLPVADSRPVLDRSADGGDAVLGVRCTACRYPAAQTGIPWCPACYGPVAPERFAATGTAWSSTVVAIRVGQRRPPFGLAYLDLDDGPRVLVHLAEPVVVPIGTRLRITGTDDGDLLAEAS